MSGGRLQVQSVDPLERAEEIKRFIVEEGGDEWAGFPAFFDRSYPDAARDGGRSWVGRDEDGRIAAHWACFPHAFRWDGRTIRAGLMLNLMAARHLRSFFPTFGFLRQGIDDLRSGSGLDLIYAAPMAQAQGILLRVGFEEVGDYGRWVLPVSEPGVGTNLLVRAYAATLGVVRGARRFTVRRLPADRVPLEGLEPLPPEPGSLVPIRPRYVLRRLLAGYPGEEHRWYAARGRNEEEPGVKALVHGPGGEGGRFRLIALYGRGNGDGGGGADLAGRILSLVPALRADGCRRLQTEAMDPSPLARALGRAGFRMREAGPAVALPLTPLGEDAVRSGAEWNLSPLDLDRPVG